MGPYLKRNLDLYRFRNGYALSTKAVANFARSELAHAIRHGPKAVNMLLAGVDGEGAAPQLYSLDYLGAMITDSFAVHGYGSYFCLSILDQFYKDGLTEDEAVSLVDNCVQELAKRFVLNLQDFKLKVVDANGVRELKNALS